MKVKSRGSVRYRLAKVLLAGNCALRWVRPPSGGFRALLFHDVPKDQIDAFDHLLRHVRTAYGVITPNEAEAFLAGHDLSTGNGRIPYLLTFDDGFKSHVNMVKEILDQHGVKAVFFVCPGLMDVPRQHQHHAIASYIFDGALYGSDLSDEMALLSWSDLEALVASGHTIGSHTAHHRRLSTLSTDELQEEIIGSAELLKTRIGIVTRWFAYPFGDLNSINRVSYEMIKKGYQFCCSGIRGVNSRTTHPLGLLREHVNLSISFEYQEFILNGGFDLYWRIRAWQLQGLVSSAGKA